MEWVSVDVAAARIARRAAGGGRRGSASALSEAADGINNVVRGPRRLPGAASRAAPVAAAGHEALGAPGAAAVGTGTDLAPEGDERASRAWRASTWGAIRPGRRPVAKRASHATLRVDP